MSKKIITSLFFALMVQSLFSQIDAWQPKKFAWAVNSGFNYSKLQRSKLELSPTVRPFVGGQGTYVFSPKWGLKTAGMFAMKASRINSSASYQQIGFDFVVAQQYKIDDLYLDAGLNFDWPVNSSIQYIGGSSSERTRVNTEAFKAAKPSVNLLLGFEFKVVDHWNLFSHFSLPVFTNIHSNFQVGVSYRIGNRKEKKESERRLRKRVSAKQIKQLRDGVLLVRLKTSDLKIEAMKKRGLIQEAKLVEAKQRSENLELMRAFKSAYSFSEIQFFKSHHSSKVRNGKLEGIFLNDSLQEDSSIFIRNKKHVFTAELSLLEEDTAKYFSHYQWVQTGHFAMVQVPVFYGGGGNTFMALVIKDRYFNQLTRPFPYYSRALFKAIEENKANKIFYFPLMLFSPMSMHECVLNLDGKLKKYHQKVLRKEKLNP